MEEIRKRIEAVAWAGLATSSGDGSTVAKALPGLLSPEPEVRARAARKIAYQVALQFDLFEAAYSVAGILVEIVKGNAPGRIEAYALLFDIANGFAPAAVKCKTPEGMLPLQEGCLKAVFAGKESYLRDLGDADAAVKLAALDLLELLPEARQAAAKRLRDLAPGEKDADTKIRFLAAAETLGAG
jgi:hypothetical protein